MSTDYYVIGMRPPDDKWLAMKEVYDVCKKTGVNIPKQVDNFFDGHEPDEKGIKVDLPIDDDNDDGETLFTLLVADIPSNITEIRCIVSI